jgi:iron(III) transport system substrate-binding protein
MRKTILSLLAGASILWSCGNETPAKKEEKVAKPTKVEELNVYTHRFYDADQELIKRFEEKTGIKVNVKKDKADKLIALLQTEGNKSKADVLVTVDAGRLGYAKELDILQALNSEKLPESIDKKFIDNDNKWVALTQRARVIVFDKDKVNPEKDGLHSFEDLTNPKWKGQINIRSANNIYNQSLVASMIERLGPEKALTWAQGVVANMAREPKGNDRDQVKQVALGKGNLAVVNTYYLGKLLNSKNNLEVEAGKKVKVLFTDQNGQGAHVNISGIGITKHAPNKENAQKFIEFLLSEEAQELYAKSNYEYPVNQNVKPSELLQSWGEFNSENIDFAILAKRNAEAIALMEKAGWK